MNATKQDLHEIEVKLNGHLTSMEARIDDKLDSYASSIRDVALELKESNGILTRLMVEAEQYQKLINVVDEEKKERSKLSDRLIAVEIRQSGMIELIMRFGVPIASSLIAVWSVVS